MKNKMNIAEWARLNGMTPEEFKHEMVLTMASIGSMDMDRLADGDGYEIAYHCGFGESAYQVIVKKI